MEGPLKYPNIRQVKFAAFCGICTAIAVFVIAPLLFRVLSLSLRWLFGPIVQFSRWIGWAVDVAELLFKLLIPIEIFLYLDKQERAGPWCFFISFCCQVLFLFLLCTPLIRLNGLQTLFPELTYYILVLFWALATSLVQWGVSLYLRHRKQREAKHSWVVPVKFRRFLCVCLLIPVLFQLGMNRLFGPVIFHHYLDALPDVEICRVEVTADQSKRELDQKEREELFSAMKKLQYANAYGPHLVSEKDAREPDWQEYDIYIWAQEGEAPSLFVIRSYIPETGLFYKVPFLPLGYWLAVQEDYEAGAVLENLMRDE